MRDASSHLNSSMHGSTKPRDQSSVSLSLRRFLALPDSRALQLWEQQAERTVSLTSPTRSLTERALNVCNQCTETAGRALGTFF